MQREREREKGKERRNEGRKKSVLDMGNLIASNSNSYFSLGYLNTTHVKKYIPTHTL